MAPFARPSIFAFLAVLAGCTTACTRHEGVTVLGPYGSARAQEDESATSQGREVVIDQRADVSLCTEAIVEEKGPVYRSRAAWECWEKLVPSRKDLLQRNPYGFGVRQGSGEDLMKNQPQVGFSSLPATSVSPSAQ